MNINPIQQNSDGTWSVSGKRKQLDPLQKAVSNRMVEELTKEINTRILESIGLFSPGDTESMVLMYVDLGEDNYPRAVSFINRGGMKKLYVPDSRVNVKYTDKIWLIYDVCGNIKKVSDGPNSIYYKCPVLEYELNEDLIYVKVQKG